MATAQPLMTAEEFGRRPDPGYPEGLVQGQVLASAIADRQHGSVCGNVALILAKWADGCDSGRLIGNGSGVITERDPRHGPRGRHRVLQL